MWKFVTAAVVLAGLSANVDSAERAPDPKDLVGSEFVLDDLGGAGVTDKARSTIKFESEEQVVGNGGCNGYFGSVELNGESIKFGPMGSTQRMCVEAVMEQERRFLAALGEAYRIVIDGTHLFIHSRAADATLRFTKMVKDPGERAKN